MSIKVIISLNVEDYSKTLSAFDAGAEARTNAGISADAYQNLDNPNKAYVIAEVESKEVFTSFFTSSGQQERMKKGGLLSPPTITFLESR